MRTVLEPALLRWWGGEMGALGDLLRVLAAPAEWAYRGGLALRDRRYARAVGARLPGLRVVSVGNLSVGGTGKTPVAAWAARVLAQQGCRPAVVARGYGRDEILLHERWNPDVPVLADPDRAAAASAARARGAGAVVLDDGFQHRRLARDVDVVLLAAEDGLPRSLLPRAPFREPVAALSRAHAVVVTRRVAPSADAEALLQRVAALFPSLVTGRIAFVPGGWERLDGSAAPAPEGPILAATSVARPAAFVSRVEAETREPAELLAFPDHHAFDHADVKAMRARAGTRTVVVTEKDAVKLLPWAATLLPSARVLRQALLWEAGEADLIELVSGAEGS